MSLSLDEFLADRDQYVDDEEELTFNVGGNEITPEQAQAILDHCSRLARFVDRMDECCSWNEQECGEAPNVLSVADDIRNLIDEYT